MILGLSLVFGLPIITSLVAERRVVVGAARLTSLSSAMRGLSNANLGYGRRGGGHF